MPRKVFILVSRARHKVYVCYVHRKKGDRTHAREFKLTRNATAEAIDWVRRRADLELVSYSPSFGALPESIE